MKRYEMEKWLEKPQEPVPDPDYRRDWSGLKAALYLLAPLAVLLLLTQLGDHSSFGDDYSFGDRVGMAFLLWGFLMCLLAPIVLGLFLVRLGRRQ